MDRQGANDVLRALRTLWPMRFPESMDEARAKETVDIIEDTYFEFAAETIIKACRILASQVDGVPGWAQIRTEAERIKGETLKTRKSPAAFATDPEGWLYVRYTDGDADWIYNGRVHKWRNALWKGLAERQFKKPGWEEWLRRYMPQYATGEFCSRYKGELERQLKLDLEGGRGMRNE